MISNKVKERLLKKNWYVECKTEQDADFVLQACDEAGVTWHSGWKATKHKPYENYPKEIGFCKNDDGITYNCSTGDESYEEDGLKNVTNWFFEELRK